MMTRKHYRAIAEILSNNEEAIDATDGKIVSDLCVMFKQDNPNFNTALFMVAVQANTKKGCAYYG
tara:strand:- start:313 stop:507 length:195 start_codon:yes stop_codon:yes gene_type:complete